MQVPVEAKGELDPQELELDEVASQLPRLLEWNPGPLKEQQCRAISPAPMQDIQDRKDVHTIVPWPPQAHDTHMKRNVVLCPETPGKVAGGVSPLKALALKLSKLSSGRGDPEQRGPNGQGQCFFSTEPVWPRVRLPSEPVAEL